MRVLTLNVGSTGLKAASFEMEAGALGSLWPVLKARAQTALAGDAQSILLNALDAMPEPARAPDVIVHRIVHGGPLVEPCELNHAVVGTLRALAVWAPAHQPAALALMEAARHAWPGARHGAAFDTTFHAGLAPWSRRLPIPAQFDAQGIHRYGFHGLAFASALRQLSRMADLRADERIVIAHLGGGASVAAIRGGTCIDTTMGLTPMGGLPMSARSGDLDPGVIFELLRRTGGDAVALERQLTHASGLWGIAGHGDLERLLDDPRADARLAIDQFVMRVAQAIASMATAVGGIAHLVFTGGAGANSVPLRARIAERLMWMGVELDPARNLAGQEELSPPTSSDVRVWRIDVDEAFELALSTVSWLHRIPGEA
jgi:acetate kinase